MLCGGEGITISRQTETQGVVDYQAKIRKLVVEDIGNAKEIAKLNIGDELFIQSGNDMYVAYGRCFNDFNKGDTVKFKGMSGEVIWKDSSYKPESKTMDYMAIGEVFGGFLGALASVFVIFAAPGPWKVAGVLGLAASAESIVLYMPYVYSIERNYGLIESVSVPI